MPRYESEEDRRNEAEIAKALTDAGLLERIEKIPLLYTVDFAGFRGGIVYRFLEMKHRNIAFGEYEGGLFISLNKMLAAWHLQEATGVPTLLVIRFADGSIYWTRAEKWDSARGIFWWGRTDRDDGNDEGPAIAYPWSAFRKVSS